MRSLNLLILLSLEIFLFPCHASGPLVEKGEGKSLVFLSEDAQKPDFITGYKTTREKNNIIFAHESAICTLEKIENLFQEKIMNHDDNLDKMAAWNRQADLRKWMGRLKKPGDEKVLIKFNKQLKKMINRLENKQVTYQVEHTWLSYCRFSRTNAFVRTISASSTRIIHFCPPWFTQSEDEQISTLIHELGHTFGMSHPHKTDTPKEAFQLARQQPELAIQSPENYESLVENYICYSPNFHP